MVESGELWGLVERTWREASFQKAIQREGHQIAARRRCIMMFMGEYNHTIDTKGLDGCLFVFPMNEWELFEQKLRTLPLTQKSARKFTRFFVAGATECELDKQGRILLPQTLREFAQLEKDVVLSGNLNRVEIWSKANWTDNNAYDDMDDIAEQMTDLGLGI